MAFSFQIATETDIDVLRAFGERLFRATYSALNTPENMELYCGKAFSPDYFEQDFRQECVHFVLAYEGTQLAAYAKIIVHSTTPCTPVRMGAEIARFYLDTPFQGKGLAYGFMEYCLSWAKGQGHTCAWLGVWPQNPRAVRFYEKEGFAKIGTADFLLGTDLQTDEIMLKEF